MLCSLPSSFVAPSPQYFIIKNFKFYSEYLYMPYVEFIINILFHLLYHIMIHILISLSTNPSFLCIPKYIAEISHCPLQLERAYN